ncbi:hypothetical protein MUK42_35193 [Musa troglodytarum]|uniref:Uncharacterized protein n=1 Tax=Musa troglodytarum TaxID=320322 RepID=A0A9E7E8L9_9LILI|nr:hypothetical protein MUK42_35193 [Musa troglodytarum]
MLILRYSDARCTPGFSEETCDDRGPNARAGLTKLAFRVWLAVNYLPVFCNMEIDLPISIRCIRQQLFYPGPVPVGYVGEGTCTSSGGSDSHEL